MKERERVNERDGLKEKDITTVAMGTVAGFHNDLTVCVCVRALIS